jgi:hypothetical protein
VIKEACRSLQRFAARDPRATAAVCSFLGLTLGFGLVWYPLALLVPCGIVFAALTWDYLRSQKP